MGRGLSELQLFVIGESAKRALNPYRFKRVPNQYLSEKILAHNYFAVSSWELLTGFYSGKYTRSNSAALSRCLVRLEQRDYTLTRRCCRCEKCDDCKCGLVVCVSFLPGIREDASFTFVKEKGMKLAMERGVVDISQATEWLNKTYDARYKIDSPPKQQDTDLERIFRNPGNHTR